MIRRLLLATLLLATLLLATLLAATLLLATLLLATLLLATLLLATLLLATLLLATLLAATLLAAACTPAACTPAHSAPPSEETNMTTTSVTSAYAPINGLRLYYEVQGKGDPLIVLHGGLGSLQMFGGNIATMAKTRQVIAVDLRGHAHTGLGDRELGYDVMADDIAGLMDHLGLEKADVLGYSLGAGVAVHVAVRHPERVRRLVVASAAFRRTEYFPEVLEGFAALGPALAEAMKASPVYTQYAEVAPKPDDFTTLVAQVGALTQRDYDWMPHVPKLPPTLLVVGDADAMRLAHTVEVFAALGGSQRDPGWDGSRGRTLSELAILPGHNHYDLASSRAFAAAVEPFLAR
jgi:pimeloyl-ACP methyl ester carboxylesterase